MSLRPDQQLLELNKLYSITIPVEYSSKLDSHNANLWINKGAVDIYVSNSSTKPTYISAMTLSNNAVAGLELLDNPPYPTYIAFKQDSGTTTEMVLSIAKAVDLGAIS